MKVTKKCAFCGQSFETRSGMQRYCSEACQSEAKRARAIQKNNLFKLAQPLMEIQHQEYLTFSKAATLMGCSRQYIYKLVARTLPVSVTEWHLFVEPTSSRCWHPIPIIVSCQAVPLHRESPHRLPHPSKRK